MRYCPPEPTAEQCSAEERLDDIAGLPAFAIWYPQMGGYVGKCVVRLQGRGSCFEAWVWHDGEFPFHDGECPAYIHHCGAEQFIEFGKTILAMEAKSL